MVVPAVGPAPRGAEPGWGTVCSMAAAAQDVAGWDFGVCMAGGTNTVFSNQTKRNECCLSLHAGLAASTPNAVSTVHF